MTLSYDITQTTAPAVTGALAARLGSYQAGRYLAAAVLVVGTLIWLRAVGAREPDLTTHEPWSSEYPSVTILSAIAPSRA